LLNYFAERGGEKTSILELINGDSSRIDVSGDYRLDNVAHLHPHIVLFPSRTHECKGKVNGKKQFEKLKKKKLK